VKLLKELLRLNHNEAFARAFGLPLPGADPPGRPCRPLALLGGRRGRPRGRGQGRPLPETGPCARASSGRAPSVPLPLGLSWDRPVQPHSQYVTVTALQGLGRPILCSTSDLQHEPRLCSVPCVPPPPSNSLLEPLLKRLQEPLGMGGLLLGGCFP